MVQFKLHHYLLTLERGSYANACFRHSAPLPYLFDELERFQHLFQAIMNRLKIEDLHRCRLSIGWIGEGDSKVQFIALVPVKAAVSIAIDQLPVATPSVSTTVKTTPFTVSLPAVPMCGGVSPTFRHSASVFAAFSSLTEKAPAWKFVPFIPSAGYGMHVTVPADAPEKSEQTGVKA